MQHNATDPPDSAARPQEIVPPKEREQGWAALLLAWTAAFSDAIGFLVLAQLGVSFMTGNSMAMGVALGQQDWPVVLQRGLPILAFFLGSLLGYLVYTLVRRRGMRSPFAVIFSLEAVCLLAFLLVSSHALQGGVIPPTHSGIFSLSVVLLTLAMGLQTSTLRRAGGQGVRTTFMTGILSDWAQNLTQFLSWWQQQSAERPRRESVRASMQQTSFRHLLLLGGVWGSYIFGAICGSALELRMALSSLIFPVFVLVVLIIVDALRPFEV